MVTLLTHCLVHQFVRMYKDLPVSIPISNTYLLFLDQTTFSKSSNLLRDHTIQVQPEAPGGRLEVVHWGVHFRYEIHSSVTLLS